MKTTLSKLPSWAWIIILAAGLVSFIGGIIAFFIAMATVEGLVSLIFIAIGVTYVMSSTKIANIINEARINQGKSVEVPFQNIMVAGAILFFALMGMAIDQTGNYFYNKPIEYFFCPENTSLDRDVDVSNPLPGRTDYVQRFTCYDPDNEEVKIINLGGVILVRFVEYIFIGYFFYYLARFIKDKNIKNFQSEHHSIIEKRK